MTKLGDNSWYMVTGGSTVSHDVRWLKLALGVGGFESGDVALTNVSDGFTLLSVQGPKSHDLLAPLVEGAR